jgi:hypothetical protein
MAECRAALPAEKVYLVLAKEHSPCFRSGTRVMFGFSNQLSGVPDNGPFRSLPYCQSLLIKQWAN